MNDRERPRTWFGPSCRATRVASYLVRHLARNSQGHTHSCTLTHSQTRVMVMKSFDKCTRSEPIIVSANENGQKEGSCHVIFLFSFLLHCTASASFLICHGFMCVSPVLMCTVWYHAVYNMHMFHTHTHTHTNTVYSMPLCFFLLQRIFIACIALHYIALHCFVFGLACVFSGVRCRAAVAGRW